MARCARGNHWSAKEGDKGCKACQKQFTADKEPTQKGNNIPTHLTITKVEDKPTLPSVNYSYKTLRTLIHTDGNGESEIGGEALPADINLKSFPPEPAAEPLSLEECLTWYVLKRDGAKIGNWGTEEHNGTITGTCHNGEHNSAVEVETLKTLENVKLHNFEDVKRLVEALSEDVCWCGEYPPKNFIEIITENSPYKQNNQMMLQNYAHQLVQPENIHQLVTDGVKWKQARVYTALVFSVTQSSHTPHDVVNKIYQQVMKAEEPQDSVWGGKSPRYMGGVTKLKSDIVLAALSNPNTPYSFVESFVKTTPINLASDRHDTILFAVRSLTQSPHYVGVLEKTFHRRVNREYRKLKRKHWLNKTTFGLYPSELSDYGLQTAEMNRDIIVVSSQISV